MEIINDVNGLFEFQDLGARTELKNKANLVQSKNLFDMTSYLNFLNALATRAIVNGTLDNIDSSSFTFTTTGHDCYTNGWTASFNTIFKIQVQQNTTYTMSWDFNGSDGFTSVFFNGVTESGNIVQTKNSKKTLTFTTKEDTTFITVRFGITDGGTSATIGKIQVEEGTENTTYLPSMVSEGVNEVDKAVADNTKSIKANKTSVDKCVTDIATNSALISKSQINVTTDKSTGVVLNDSSDCNIVDLICDSDNYNLSIYGKNLFNLKNTRIWINNYAVPASLIVDNNSINFDITPGNFCGVYIKYNETVKDNLLIDKSCVISLNVTADKDCKFRLRDENTNTFEVKNLTSNIATQFNLPITLNNSGKAISMYGINIGENTHIKISNIMIELGAVATEYEDYKDFQSVTQDTDLSTVHTYYPNTTVIADSDVQLSYVADTKHYIDNKFNELATAIVAHESGVN